MTIPTWAIRTKADEAAAKAGAYWDEDKAEAIITFAETVYRPQFIAGDFRLLPWQSSYLKYLYGWRNPDGTRRFRTVCLHIAKKNGKTLLVSIISAYELLKSEDPSPFVVTGSVSRDNAAQVFSELDFTLTSLFGTKAKKDKFCKISKPQKSVKIASLNGEYRSLSSDGDRQQGWNCSLVILDEAHAHKSASLYDSLRYATAARPNGLLVVISTAGDDVTQWYHSLYSKSKRVLSGDDLDTTHAAFVYEADEGSAPEDERQWSKANPSLGVSFSADTFRLDLAGASKDPAELNRFRRYRLNQWVRPDEKAYFDIPAWDKCKGHVPDDVLKRAPAWIGVDLSQTTDPSSVSIVWALPDRKFFVRSWGWVADEGVRLRNASNMPQYQQFANAKEMTITPGNAIDSREIFRHLADLTRTYRVKLAVFDADSAYAMMADAESIGIKCLRQPQTHAYYSGPMKELHTAIIEGRIVHEGSQWLRYCLANVRVDESKDGLIRPNKKRSIDKIDGAISLMMAYSQAGAAPASAQTSRYDSAGIDFF